MENMMRIAAVLSVNFEWLATGNGGPSLTRTATDAVQLGTFAENELEDQLLAAARRLSERRLRAIIRFIEELI